MTLLGRNFVEQIYKLKILPNRRRHYCNHVSSSILTQTKLYTNLENCTQLRQTKKLQLNIWTIPLLGWNLVEQIIEFKILPIKRRNKVSLVVSKLSKPQYKEIYTFSWCWCLADQTRQDNKYTGNVTKTQNQPRPPKTEIKINQNQTEIKTRPTLRPDHCREER